MSNKTEFCPVDAGPRKLSLITNPSWVRPLTAVLPGGSGRGTSFSPAFQAVRVWATHRTLRGGLRGACQAQTLATGHENA